MFGFFKSHLKKDEVEESKIRRMLIDCTTNDLQSLLHIDYYVKETGKTGSHVLITDADNNIVTFDSGRYKGTYLYTYYGCPIDINLNTLEVFYLVFGSVKITNVRYANEEETRQFLNDMLSDNVMKNFQLQLSEKEQCWQNTHRNRDYENESAIYYCKVGKDYRFMDEINQEVKGKVVANKTVRFQGDDETLLYMTGLMVQKYLKNGKLEDRASLCIHCVSIDKDDYIQKYSNILDANLIVDQDIFRHPIWTYTIIEQQNTPDDEDVLVLTEEHRVKDIIKPEENHFYLVKVNDEGHDFVFEGKYISKRFGVYYFKNKNKKFFINPSNILEIKLLTDK